MFNDATDLTLTSFFAGEDNPSLLPLEVRVARNDDQDGYGRVFGKRRDGFRTLGLGELFNVIERMSGKTRDFHHPLLDCGEKRDTTFDWYCYYSSLFNEVHISLKTGYDGEFCDRCGVVLNLLNRFEPEGGLCDFCRVDLETDALKSEPILT